MSTDAQFTVTNEHIALLRRAYVGWDGMEFGAPAIDCKRPYGNSDVLRDIHLILGGLPIEDQDLTVEQEVRYRRLHEETRTALQIFLVTGEMRPGRYRQPNKYDATSWVADD